MPKITINNILNLFFNYNRHVYCVISVKYDDDDDDDDDDTDQADLHFGDFEPQQFPSAAG